MSVPSDLRYSKTHEWVKVDGDTATVGISAFAQEQLSDLTFVELPSVGDALESGGEAAVVESVKAASDVYAPISGTVTDVNSDLETKPELVNSDPYGSGWLFKMSIDDSSQVEELDSPQEYEKLLPGDG